MKRIWMTCAVICYALPMANCLDDMSDMDANENQTSYFESILQEDFPMVDCKELLRRRSEELQKFEQEKKFSEVFATVIHDIGYTMLQDQLDEHVLYSTGASNQRMVLERLVEFFEAKFQIYANQLTRVKDAIVGSYNQDEYPLQYPSCCEKKKQEDELCLLVTKSHRDAMPQPEFSEELLLDAFKGNIANQSDDMPVYQYFGTAGGILYYYPSSNLKMRDCLETDVRYRPWFRTVISPTMQLVIIIDISTEMKLLFPNGDVSLLNGAKHLAKQIVQSMTMLDRVIVMGFAEKAYFAHASDYCFTSELTLGTDAYKKNVIEFIDYMLAVKEKSDYLLGLQQAFVLFNGTQNSTHVERVILYISGAPSISNIRDVEQEVINIAATSSIKVFAMNLGENSDSQYMLQAMVQAEPRGLYIPILDEPELENGREKFLNYLQYSSSKISPGISISLPYVDILGAGVVMTVSMPVFVGDQFLGVLGIDTPPQEIYRQLRHFRMSAERHFFMIYRDSGSTFYHPLMPAIHTTKDVIYMNIDIFESQPDQISIIKSMRRGDSGSKQTYHIRVWPRGHPLLHGVQKDLFDSQYIWSTVIGTPFSLCLAFDNMNQEVSYVLDNDGLVNISFAYHIDVPRKNLKGYCRSYTRLAVADEMSVIFTSTAFTNSDDYTKMNTRAYVDMYKDIFSGKINSTLLTKHAVNSLVIVSDVMQALSKGKLEGGALVTYLSWRYIALESGVFCINPAVAVPVSYQHTQRYWYRVSLGAKGRTIVSTPYLDKFGSSWVVTISKALIMRDTNTSRMYTHFGVIGGDITLLHLSYLIKTSFTKCGEEAFRCMLVDEGGYLIFHEDMVAPPAVRSRPQIEYVHLIEKEPVIAVDLISRKIMKRDHCFNVIAMRKHFYYSIAGSTRFHQEDVDYPIYTIDYFADTNIFLLAMPAHLEADMEKNVNCICDEKVDDIPPTCTNESLLACECPCHMPDKLYVCPDEFSYLDWRLCSPTIRQTDDHTFVAKERPVIKELDECYDRLCSEKRHMSECHMMSGCRWCEENTNGVKLHTPFCARFEVCFYGRLDYPSPYPTGEVLRVGPIIFLVFIFTSIFAIAGGYAMFRKKLSNQAAFEDLSVD